jgi:hypothetical protein
MQGFQDLKSALGSLVSADTGSGAAALHPPRGRGSAGHERSEGRAGANGHRAARPERQPAPQRGPARRRRGRLRAIEDPAERVRLAFKLFDSEGVALVNLLSDGSGALEGDARAPPLFDLEGPRHYVGSSIERSKLRKRSVKYGAPARAGSDQYRRAYCCCEGGVKSGSIVAGSGAPATPPSGSSVAWSGGSASGLIQPPAGASASAAGWGRIRL